MSIINVLLMAAPQGGDSNPLMNFLPIVLVGVVFYFFMIRPQTKKMKDQKSFVDSIKKGDKVITIAGIHGKIAEVNDDSFILEIENNVRMKIEKTAISLDASKKLENK
jgi:preprotein translocase subunit YajC